MLYFSLIKGLALFLTPNTNGQVVKQSMGASSEYSAFAVVVVIVVTVIMAALSLYVIFKLPSTLAKTSKKVVHTAAEGVAPLVLQAQHKKDTKKNRLKLSAGLTIAMKIILVITPVILAFSSQFLSEKVFDFYLAMIISFWLFSFCVVFFAIQYLLAWVLPVKRSDLW